MPARWYIVHAYSNFEKKVAESIEEGRQGEGPLGPFRANPRADEKVIEVRRGRKVDSERKFFPGYVMVRANLTDEVFHLIKNTPKVTGFLGSDNKPVPITDKEADQILGQIQEGVERPKPSVSFEVGEQVRVSDGPFASFNGVGAGSRRGAFAPQGGGFDFRPGDPGRTGIRSGRKGLTGENAVGEKASLAGCPIAPPTL
jgi:transcriptional antiterminator NusG